MERQLAQTAVIDRRDPVARLAHVVDELLGERHGIRPHVMRVPG